MNLDYYNSPTNGKMTLRAVAQDIVEYVKIDPEGEYQLIIGTDSEGNGKVDFVTAIVIYHKGSGGRFFWRKTVKSKIHHLRQKIFEEVLLSLQNAENLIPELKRFWQKEDLKSALEIHIDAGENGPTKDLIKEVTGLVLGMGYHPKTKPESYGASMVADRFL